MKAYQLKISLKNSHPPIWRRCVVPAGLSFSQLSVIFNEIMGWNGSHLSSFTFPNERITFEEQLMDSAFSDAYSAEEYLVDTFIESAKWFTYIYDFGDYWEHRVQVEKVLEDYEKNYPTVLKYRENSPWEDCGGLYGYYEKLKILQDPTHPEYQEISEWAWDLSDFSYDMDAVNHLLSHLYLDTKKSKPMSQTEIYQDLWKGQPLKRIRGKRRMEDASIEQAIEEAKEDIDISGERLQALEEMLQKLEEKLQQKKLASPSRAPDDVQLSDIFRCYRKEDLTAIAKAHELKGAYKYTKSKLTNFLQKELLTRDVMCRYLTYLEEEEYLLLKEAAQKPTAEFQPWSEYARPLLAGGYCGSLSTDDLLIPAEVCQAFRENCTPQWEEERQEKLRFLYLANAGAQLYGIFPMEEFLRQYQSEKEPDFNEFQFLERCHEIPENRKKFALIGRDIVLKELNDPQILALLAKKQEGLDFYPMNESQIRTLSCEGYIPFDIPMIRLQKFLEKEFQKESDDSKMICSRIQYLIRMGCPMEKVFDYLQDALSLEEEMVAGIMQLLVQVWNFTGMVCNRGYSPSEISHNKHQSASKKARKSTGTKKRIVDFVSYKEGKIHPYTP